MPPACTVHCDAPHPRLPPRRPQVLINASFYAQHLPRSLAGVVYFDDVAMPDKIQATRIYVQMLDHYPHLHEGSIPLLEINRKALIAASEGLEKRIFELENELFSAKAAGEHRAAEVESLTAEK